MKKILLSLSLSFVVAGTVLAAGNFSDGLVGFWRFNGSDRPGAIVRDRSGNKNHGTIMGDPNHMKGIRNRAFIFDGIDDYVDLGTVVGDFELTDKFTISAWIKPDVMNGVNRGIVSRMPADTIKGWHVRVTEWNTLRFVVRSGNYDVAWTDTHPISAGQWYQVVAVWDGAKPMIYVNGVLDSAYDIAGGLSTIGTAGHAYIGYDETNNRYFDGAIDEVRIYNRALSAQEVSNLFNAEN